MHNTLNRLQNTFSYLTSCAFFIALLITAISILPINSPSSPARQPPSAKISVRNVQVVRGRPHYYSPKREEYAHIRFDLDADLSPLFDWNTKQVFVYVSAEYPAQEEKGQGQATAGFGGDGGGDEEEEAGLLLGGGNSGINKAVIWDTIIPAPASKWSFSSVRERYWPAKGQKKGSQNSSKSRTAKTTDITKPGLLVLKNQKPKYQITDPSGIISSRSNATLTLGWNVQPWVGALLWDKGILRHKTGSVHRADRSWNLPFLKHQWQGGVLPRSERFDFPPLKGSQKTPDVVKDKDGQKTPEPAEASGVV